MSLLLDALKKAADDKKKSVDDSTDEAPAQDNRPTNHEDSLELELDEKQIIDSSSADDNNFPQVEESSIASSTDDYAITETVSKNTFEHPRDVSSSDDTAHTEAPVEPQLADIQTADTELTEWSDETHTDPPKAEAETATDNSAYTVSDSPAVNQLNHQTTVSEPVNTVSSAIRKADRRSRHTDNEAALSALINKSNQYQQRAQKKRMILLITLILLLITGSAGFFYLKADMASQQLYITQNNSAPLLREAETTKQNPPSSDDKQTSNVVADNNRSKTTAAAQTVNTTSPSREPDRPVIKLPAAQSTQSAPRAVTGKSTDAIIRIQQSSRKDPVESLIRNAYNAFQRGDYERAKTRYQQVLSHEAKNRDATLGLAAIALKQQRYEYARQKYQSLLQLNPKDTLAIAGLSSLNQISLQSSASSGLTESQLKFMLKEQPDAAHLYFALGSLYAAQNQWPKAQSAYFSAWSGDSNNADYAFNLAVSLDHINQPQQALQYYQLSLKLMQRSAANFSAAQVQQRINSLQRAMQ